MFHSSSGSLGKVVPINVKQHMHHSPGGSIPILIYERKDCGGFTQQKLKKPRDIHIGVPRLILNSSHHIKHYPLWIQVYYNPLDMDWLGLVDCVFVQ